MLEVSWTSCLFTSPISHPCFWSWPIVIHCWGVIFRSGWEEFYCWISLNSKPCSQFFIFSGIDFSYFNFSFESGCQGSPFWCQSLAVSTPRGIEFDKPRAIILQHIFVKTSIIKNYDIFIVASSPRSARTSTRRCFGSNSIVSDLDYSWVTFLYSERIKSTIPFAVRSPL